MVVSTPRSRQMPGSSASKRANSSFQCSGGRPRELPSYRSAGTRANPLAWCYVDNFLAFIVTVTMMPSLDQSVLMDPPSWPVTAAVKELASIPIVTFGGHGGTATLRPYQTDLLIRGGSGDIKHTRCDRKGAVF